MHQQVRTSIKKAARSDDSGEAVGAQSLVEVLTVLQGMNLQSAGRLNPTRGDGGELVFSIQHEDGDDSANKSARNALRDAKYKAEAYDVEYFLLEHREGALLECIRDFENKRGQPVIEVYVLAPADPDGPVPVQLVTAPMLKKPLGD
jgi:hypothetical protein